MTRLKAQWLSILRRTMGNKVGNPPSIAVSMSRIFTQQVNLKIRGGLGREADAQTVVIFHDKLVLKPWGGKSVFCN
jgi:hypothetical protein